MVHKIFAVCISGLGILLALGILFHVFIAPRSYHKRECEEASRDFGILLDAVEQYRIRTARFPESLEQLLEAKMEAEHEVDFERIRREFGEGPHPSFAPFPNTPDGLFVVRGNDVGICVADGRSVHMSAAIDSQVRGIRVVAVEDILIVSKGDQVWRMKLKPEKRD